MKPRIHVIDKPETNVFMAKNTEIASLANTIKLHIQTNLHFIYQQEFYKDEQKKIYDLSIEYLVPVMYDIDHSTFIEEYKQNIDAAAYEIV